VAVLLTAAAPVSAHQLDEYLQAARLAVARDRVVVDLVLTPGASIAARVLAGIDGDRNGVLSPLEIEAYARRVLQDMTLRVDDEGRALELVRADAASGSELRDGIGTIRLQASAALALPPGRHRVIFENGHEPEVAVYLANAVMPASSDVTLGPPRRDPLQRRIEIDVELQRRGAAAWVLLPIGVTALLLTRRRST
jgi:hypothetical protein